MQLKLSNLTQVWSPRLFGHLVGYLFIAITSSRVHRLRSFFNMMRAALQTLLNVFSSAVLEKLASKVARDFNSRNG